MGEPCHGWQFRIFRNPSRRAGGSAAPDLFVRRSSDSDWTCAAFLAVMMVYNLIRPVKMAHAKPVCK